MNGSPVGGSIFGLTSLDHAEPVQNRIEDPLASNGSMYQPEEGATNFSVIHLTLHQSALRKTLACKGMDNRFDACKTQNHP